MIIVFEIYKPQATGNDYHYDDDGELFPHVVKVDPPVWTFVIDALNSIICSCE